MKRLFFALLLGSLASCSQSEPTPPAALTEGVWALQTERVLATPTDGSAATTQEVAPMTGPVTLTFTSDTRFSVTVAYTDRFPQGYYMEGVYTYQGATLDFPRFYSWNTRLVVPRTLQVTELNAQTLVTQYQWASPGTRYVTTHIYTR